MSASSFYHRRKSVKDVLNFIDDFIACSLAVVCCFDYLCAMQMLKYLFNFNFSFNRKVTLVMVGLDNAGKTATVRGIQGGIFCFELTF